MKSNTSLYLSYVLLFCSLILATDVQAKKMPIQTNRIWNTDIVPGVSAAVSAALPDDCSHISGMLNSGVLKRDHIANRIVFGVSQSCPPAPMPCYSYQPESYMIELDLTVTFDKLYSVGATYLCSTETRNICMFIEYRTDGMYIDQSVYEFEDGNNVQVTINDTIIRTASGTIPPMNIYLDVQLEEERFYIFTPSTSSITLGTPSYSSTDGELLISWTPVDWAEEYELEWTYIDDYNVASGDRIHIPFNEGIFRFNSTRVSTTASSYKIPLVYGQGYIVYRLRGLGDPDAIKVLYPGNWNPTPTSPASQVGHFAHFDITANSAQHEDYLNWQFSASYAEEGKSKVSVNYFDGSLRSRQMVTKAKTDNTTVVGETIYDHQGRAAVNVLPVPTFQTKIKYHSLFNLNMSSKPYNRSNFDLDDVDPCEVTLDSMKSVSGAAKYYSFQRLSMGSTTNADNYLPESFGFPFTQTVFTPDNTGRIRSQSGPGKELRIGSGKETRYFYGKPFQEELDQLFGYEAGDALHYKKNMVFDPNGQVSISYLDPAGKVVATSLTGSLPSNVSAMPSLPGTSAPYLSFDLLNKTRPTDNSGSENILDLHAGTLTISRELLFDKEGVRSFGYYLSGSKFSMQCTTETSTSVCYNCVLDLEISLKDQCGVEQLSGINTSGANTYTLGTDILEDIKDAELNGTAFNPTVSCNNETAPLLTFSKGLSGTPRSVDQTWNTLSSIKKGSYTLNKILKVNKEALDYYTKDYLNSACLTPLSQFVTEEMAKIDLTTCDNDLTCAECSTQVGPRSRYQNPANDNTDCGDYPCLTDNQYDMLLVQCAQLCEGLSCSSLLTGMKADMSLHGQYGEVLANPVATNGAVNPGARSTEYNPYLYPLSVFNEANLLPVRKINGVVKFPNWRFPFDGAYRNEAGQISYVKIIKDPDNGTYSPSILPMAISKLIVVNEEENEYKIQPQYLLHVQDFIKNWNKAWVNSLVPYHPEYGYYLFCKELDKSGSNAYDELLYNQTEFVGTSDPNFEKLMLPLGQVFNSSNVCAINTSITPNDPLFVSGSTNVLYDVEDVRAMQNAMCNYTLLPTTPSTNMSIWELAYKLAYCPKSIFPSATSACSTCTMPFVTVSGNQVPDFSGVNEDKAWQIFRMLYMSLKQRLTEKKAAASAILYTNSYSECIGNANFDPSKYNFSLPGTYSPLGTEWMYTGIWNFPYYGSTISHSQFFNFEQPCNWSRYYLYKEKTPRYKGVSSSYDLVQSVKDLMEKPNGQEYLDGSGHYVNDGIRMSPDAAQEIVNKNANLTDLTLFQRCEKCPMAQDLELLLNAMIQNKTCSLTADLINQSGCLSGQVPIGCNNTTASYQELTDDLENVIGGSIGTGKLNWQVDNLNYNSGDQYWYLSGSFWATISGTPTQLCSLELRTPNGTDIAYDFTTITSFCCLKYLPVPQYLTPVLNKNFQITAIIPDAGSPGGYKEIILEGVTSCINVTACTFEPVCTPTQEANHIMALFNSLVNYQNPNCSTATNALLEPTCPFDLTSPSQQFYPSFSSLLRYVTDSKICYETVKLNEQWEWETKSVSAGTLVASIQAPSSTSQTCTVNSYTPKCSIKLNMPSGSSYNFTHILKFANIRPDPSNQEGAFLMEALVDNGSTREYITISGLAPCYNFGACVTDMPNPVRSASPIPRKLTCKRSAEADSLLAFLRQGDATKIANMTGGTIQKTKQIPAASVCDDDGTSCKQNIKDDFNNIIIPYLNFLHAVESYYNPGSGLCSEDVKLYTFYNYTSSPLLNGCLNPGDTLKLMWGPCCSFDIVLNPANCKAQYQVFCQQVVGGTTIYSSWWSRDLCATCVSIPGSGTVDGTCLIQFEPLPAGSGYSFADVRGVEDLQPDPDRPTPGQGYFIAYLKMNDGNIVAVKGYNDCMPMGECTDCDTKEMIDNGDFSQGYLSGGFTSDYSHSTAATDCPPYNSYFVKPSSVCNGSSPAITDHTNNARMFGSAPNGLLLFGESSATGNKTAWKNTYNVVKGNEYELTIYYMNGNDGPHSTWPENKINVQFNGSTVARQNVVYKSDRSWQTLSVKWLADDDQLEIKIINEVNHVSNVLAIDDISLHSFCACNDVPLASNTNFDNYDYEIDYSDVLSTLQLTNGAPHAGAPIVPPPTGMPAAALNFGIFKAYGSSAPYLLDHNQPGKGRFMVFRLDNTSNQAIAWRQILNVSAFTEYSFSSWFSAESANGMQVELYINNTLVTKASNDASVAPSWFVLGGRWNSGNANQAELVIKVINNSGSSNFFALDDIVFRRQCQGGCTQPHYTDVSFQSPGDNCVENLTNIAHHNAQIRYDEYISGIEADFQEKYIAKCLQVYEEFLMLEQDNGHHFTLYYYDQSGQLVRTVPPLGFRKITNSDTLAQIRIDRANGKRTTFTAHNMTTTYTYNSLNQLVQQSVPDNDDMDIWDIHEYGTTVTGLSGFNASSFVNNHVGTVVGATTANFASIFNTTNSGKAWNEIKYVHTGKPLALQIEGGSAYMISADQKLLYSADNGANWQIKNTLPLGHTWVGMFFSSTTAGDITDDNGHIYSTTNSGDTWTNSTKTITLASGDKVKLLQMYDANYGMALGTSGNIYKTSNGWTSTSDISTVRSVGLAKVEMFDENVGYAVGEEGTLLITENAGNSWKEIPSALTVKLIDVHFRSYKSGCVLDATGGVYTTSDKGASWTKVEAPLDEDDKIAAFDFQNKLEGLAITQTGKLLGTIDGGMHWIKLAALDPLLDISIDYITAFDMISATEAFATDNNNKLYFIRFILNQWNIVTCSACSLSLPSGITAAKLQFSNVQKGTVLGSDHLLYYIETDLSLTPNDVPVTSIAITTSATPLTYVTSGDEVADVRFVSATLTYALTKYGEVFQSADKCSTWTSASSANSSSAHSFTSITLESVNNIVLCAATNGELFKAPVSSWSWSDKSNTVTPPAIRAIQVLDVNNSYAAGEDGTLMVFDESTDKWTTLKTGTSKNLNAVAFNDLDHGLITGETYAAFTSNAGSTCTWSVTDFYAISLPTGPAPDKVSLPAEATYNAALAISSTEYYIGGTEGWMFKFNPSGSPQWTYNDALTAQDITLMHHNGSDKILTTDKTLVDYTSTTTWTTAQTLLPSVLNDVQLMDNNMGYAVGNYGNIIKTFDGGQTWTSIYSPTAEHLKAVHFVNEFMGYIAGNNGALFRTVNGGVSWVDYSSTTSNTINDIHFVESNLAFICGAGNMVMHCNNPFAATPSWTNSAPTSLITGATFNAIHSADDKYGYVVGNNDVMLRYKYVSSTNSITWEARLLNSSTPWAQYHTGATGVNITDVKFRDHLTGYVITSNGAILKTTDKGVSWSLEKTQTASPYYNSTTYNDLCMIDDHHLFLSGNGSNSKNFLYLYDQKNEFSSRFYYDKLGRLVVSQNAEQYARGLAASKYIYSYTNYDFKGRITEVGEIAATVRIEDLFVSEGNRLRTDTPLYQTWLTGNTRTQVTKTYYDYRVVSPTGTYVNPSSFTSTSSIADNEYTCTFDNLRGRVSSITFEDADDANDATYQYAIHYSYDVHGNVKNIVNEANIELTGIGNRYVIKQVDYDYDLVSGKVNNVILNPWKKDKFLHRYEYDADNRITQVYTSHDGSIWQNDARYRYYKHGPLARTELGHDNVQGMDYAYTMQGWLKGVNSNTLVNTERDMGKDGFRPSSGTNPNQIFAPDEFGFTLNYFSGDYAAINSPVASAHFTADIPGTSNLAIATTDLFNGNISHMVTAIRQFMLGAGPGKKSQAMAYKYDQLNRLASTRKLQNVDLVNNQWQNNIALDDDYEESYEYDANGNIVHLQRKGISDCGSPASNDIDDLVYKYEHTDYSTSYTKKTNRLRAVIDGISAAVAPGTNDIKNGQQWLTTPGSSTPNPANDNYQYDRLGNLIEDKQEEIAAIEWTTYGKIKSITRTSSSLKPDLEFAYDPSGNRVLKIVKPRNGSGVMAQNYWKYTYYVRDAQGNTLANYNHFGDRPYTAESYLLYGSSRLGEYLPRKYSMGCGESVDVTLWTSWTDAAAWAESYLHRLGYDPSYQTYWNSKWSGIGASFSSTNPKALQALVNAWMEWMCSTRCVRYSAMSDGYSSLFDTFWSDRLSEANAAGGFTDFEATYMHNLENYVWPSAFETFTSENSTEFGCDDCNRYTYAKGGRHFELSNHLGNVMVTVSDRKIAVDEEYQYNPSATTRYLRNGKYTTSADGDFEQTTGTDGLASEYLAEVITANDYYPFGMIMPGRSYVKPLSCSGSESCIAPEQVLMNGQAASWVGFSGGTPYYNSVQDRQEINMNAAGSGAEYTISGMPTGGESATVSIDVQAGTYNNVNVGVYDMGGSLVGSLSAVSAGAGSSLNFTFASTATQYKVRLTGASTSSLNITPTWQGNSYWLNIGTGSHSYNSGTSKMEITANATADGASITYNAPHTGQTINLSATLETGNNPVTVSLYDNTTVLQTVTFTTPNSSNSVNFTVSSNTAAVHLLKVTGSPTMTPNPVGVYSDPLSSAQNWTATGTGTPGYSTGPASVNVTVYAANDGAYQTFLPTLGNGNPLDFDLSLNTNANPVTVELYDPATNTGLLSPVIVPAGQTAYAVNFHLTSGTLTNYGIRTTGNPTPSTSQIVTNGESSIAWAAIGGGSSTYTSPNLNISAAASTDGASATFTTTSGATENGSLSVTAGFNNAQVLVYDNSGTTVLAGPYVVTAGTTATVTFSCTATTTGCQVQVTSVGITFPDNIAVTAFNVWETVQIPDNYSITQLDITETQYIAVPDMFKLSNLSVTATPYPDVAYVTKLNVSYAKPYSRPLCSNNNDKLKANNTYSYGFNGMERDDEVYGDGNSYDFGARIYNPRIGRWLSVDPLSIEYPYVSPYVYVSCNPLRFVDREGKFLLDVHHRIALEALAAVNGTLVKKKGILHDILFGSEESKFMEGYLGKNMLPHEGGISDPDIHHSGELGSTYEKSMHFDNMNSDEIFDNIKKIDAQVNGMIEKYNNGGSAFALGYETGQIAHAVQDLYSHSNYIEIYAQVYPNQKDVAKIPTIEEAMSDPQFSKFSLALKNKDPKKGLIFQSGAYPGVGPNSHKSMNKDVGRESVFGDLMPETKGQKVTWASTAAEAVATKATAILLNKVATGTKEE